MEVRRCAGLLILIAALNPFTESLTAAEPDPDAVSGSAPVSSPRSTPWVSSKMPNPVTSRIETSFGIAEQRLDEVADCRALFSDLDADGLEMLHSTMYYPADQTHERRGCRNAWAYTTVGAAPTFLCRKFSKISDKRGALILIHEALHHAGLGEYPVDREGLTSGAINDLVADACDL